MLSFFGLIFKILPHNLCLVLNKFSKNCSVVNYRCENGEFSFYKCFLSNIYNFFRCCCFHLNCFYCGIYGEFSLYKCFLSLV
jgi:hypothetical protein